MQSGGASPMVSVGASRTSTPSSLNPNAPRRTKICVYCGSSPGHDPAHLEAARDLARVMAANNIALVYGGGTVGLMGELAKTLVSLSGPDAVHGIIPEALVKYERDPTYTSQHTPASSNSPAPNGSGSGSSSRPAAATTTSSGGPPPLAVPEERTYGRTTVVKDMHTRKQLMAREVLEGGPGSGFLALSGGYGTLEELMETTTWNQLGIHDRGICVLNINGFYDGVLQWIRRGVQDGFIRPGNADIVVEAKTAEEAVRALMEYKVSESVLKLAWGNE